MNYCVEFLGGPIDGSRRIFETMTPKFSMPAKITKEIVNGKWEQKITLWHVYMRSSENAFVYVGVNRLG